MKKIEYLNLETGFRKTKTISQNNCNLVCFVEDRECHTLNLQPNNFNTNN